ncbi:MAG: glycosyltransferase family 2 protein, partial [Actinomycetota bacterium]
TTSKKLISIVIPAYNEEDCVNELARQLTKVMDKLKKYQFEVLIVENGSRDKTWSLLQKIAATDKRFKPIRLSRNFGMDGGVTAGLELATGDACVIMTADLQDPPELIIEFAKKWEEGFENIYMIVEKRETSGFFRRINSRMFYFVADRLTGGLIPKGVSDFRLVDRKVYEAVRSMNESNRFVRGLFAWVGFKSFGISRPRPARFGGESKAKLTTVLRLAKHGILSFSDVPLRFITWFGIGCSGIALGTMVIFAILKFIIGTPFAGFATIVTIILFFFGLLSFMIGILAEYVAMIHSEVKNRPNFIIAEVINKKY